jgi:hypothetical protein
LLGLIEREALDREKRSAERRVKNARFPVIKTLDSWYESECGFNDLQLYGKHQVLREPDWPMTISIGGRAFAPTGSSGGFSAEEWWTGEFIAFSREIGSWRIAGHVGWNDYGNTLWKDNHHWGNHGLLWHLDLFEIQARGDEAILGGPFQKRSQVRNILV